MALPKRNAWAIKEFRVNVYGTKFTSITDHSALTWLMGITDPKGRLARWAIYLDAQEFEILHRKGSIHKNALSRPVLIERTMQAIDRGAFTSPKSLEPGGQISPSLLEIQEA